MPKRKTVLQKNYNTRADDARKVARWLTYFSYVLALWCVFYPVPYLLVITSCFLLPMVALVSVYKFNPLLSIDGSIKDSVPGFSKLFIPSWLALIIRSQAYDLIEHWPVIIATAVIAIILAIVLPKFFPDSFEDNNAWFQIFLGVVLIPFLYFPVVLMNCAYDFSSPRTYEVKVLEKEIDDHSRGTDYDITVSPWADQEQTTTIEIAEDMYDELSINSTIIIVQHPGLVGAAWIEAYP